MEPNFHYYSPCPRGFEDVLESELKAIGATDILTRPGGASYQGNRALGYKACLWLRTAIRVQQTILRAKAENDDQLYHAVKKLDWSHYLRLDDTFAVHAALRDSNMTHSQFVSRRVKDAISDHFREKTGKRPDVNPKRPTVPLRLTVIDNRAVLSRDLAGGSLHKRGWRPIQVKSPLNECIAAGIALRSGWDGSVPLVDPMCGSGSLLVEAAFIALDRAPGLNRNFAFDLWPDFDADAWRELKEEARRRVRDRIAAPIIGADRHAGALELAKKGAHAAGVGAFIDFVRADVGTFVPKHVPGVVLVNPPYGKRIGEGEDLADAWHDLGTFLHEQCPGATAWIISGDATLTKKLRLRAEQKYPCRNGSIECRLLKYSMRKKDEKPEFKPADRGPSTAAGRENAPTAELRLPAPGDRKSPDMKRPY
jgi:putative N6-adenine-specific DNA methylase